MADAYRQQHGFDAVVLVPATSTAPATTSISKTLT